MQTAEEEEWGFTRQARGDRLRNGSHVGPEEEPRGETAKGGQTGVYRKLKEVEAGGSGRV